jgi:hypothetical protein
VAWYPRRTHYYTPLEADAEIEQGDIFWGVPSLSATHPALADQFHPPDELPQAEQLRPPPLSDVLRGVRVYHDPVIVVPHTCDFYAAEKGKTHRDRLVARVQLLAGSGVEDPSRLRSGEGYAHTFFLPSWKDPTSDSGDCFVNLRHMTTVDSSYLSRDRRLARLSPPALICFRRRITQFFTDYAPLPSELVEADERGGLLREGRALIPLALLKSAFGDEAVAELLRQFYGRGSG